MKNLNLFTGGHPKSIQDLKHLQIGVKQVFDALLAGLTPGTSNVPYVIVGCGITVSGSNVTVAGGWIYLNAEVIRVVAGTITLASGQAAYLRKSEVTESYGTLTYADGNSRNVHTETILTPTALATATAVDFNVNAMVPMSQTIGDLIGFNVPKAWTNITLNADFIVSNILGTPQYFKDANGMVHLRGGVEYVGAFTSIQVPITTMPTGLRPSTNNSYHNAGHYGTGDERPYYICRMKVFTDGIIQLQDHYDSSGLSGDPSHINLTGISYHIF